MFGLGVTNTREVGDHGCFRPGAGPSLPLALLIVILTLAWRWLWGSCWNPIETACFQGPGDGDHLQHFYGWLAYAQGEPRLELPPIISNWSWPFNTPLLFTDSIPIAAVLLRPLARLTGVYFQYFSLLSLLSILACGYCGFQIACQRYASPSAGVALGLLLGLSPPSIIRFSGHEALGLHALVVVPLTLLILRSKLFWPWLLILFVATGVHAYFVPMVICLAIIRLYSDGSVHSRLATRLSALIFESKGGRRLVLALSPKGAALLIDAIQLLLVLCLGYVVFGYGYGQFDVAPKGDIWSANILAIIDPQGQSSVFPSLSKVEPYQWEGFAYLGLASTLFISFGIYRLLMSPIPSKRLELSLYPIQRMFWALICLAFLFSLGPAVYLGSTKLFSIESPMAYLHLDALYRLFRACGRFVWLLYYALSLWGFDQFARATKNRKIFMCIVMLLLLETHIPALANTKSTLRNHFQHGVEWKQSMQSADAESLRLVQVLRKADYLINATGDPMLMHEQLPKYLVQSINPVIKTNYHPYMLARSPKEFRDYYSRDSCSIVKSTARRDRHRGRKLYILSGKEESSLCSLPGLTLVLPLSGDYGLYAFGPVSPVMP